MESGASGIGWNKSDVKRKHQPGWSKVMLGSPVMHMTAVDGVVEGFQHNVG